jgi:hypothetical protein
MTFLCVTPIELPECQHDPRRPGQTGVTIHYDGGVFLSRFDELYDLPGMIFRETLFHEMRWDRYIQSLSTPHYSFWIKVMEGQIKLSMPAAKHHIRMFRSGDAYMRML